MEENSFCIFIIQKRTAKSKGSAAEKGQPFLDNYNKTGARKGVPRLP